MPSRMGSMTSTFSIKVLLKSGVTRSHKWKANCAMAGFSPGFSRRTSSWEGGSHPNALDVIDHSVVTTRNAAIAIRSRVREDFQLLLSRRPGQGLAGITLSQKRGVIG